MDLQQYPCVHSETCHWTALTFATATGHIAIVQVRRRHDLDCVSPVESLVNSNMEYGSYFMVDIG